MKKAWERTSFTQQIQELQQLQALPHLYTGREQVSASLETAVDRKAPKAINRYSTTTTCG